MTASLAHDDQARGVLSNAAQRMGVALRLVPPPQVVTCEKAPRICERPTNARTMIGQEKARVQLLMHLESARKRDETPGHILLFGPAGLGKTSMAELVAHETGRNLVQTIASAVNTPTKLGKVLAKLKDRDVLFIDEVHSLPMQAKELLYKAMEDGEIELNTSTACGPQMVSVDVAEFTLVGATTKPGKLEQPLRDRFALILALVYYTDDELAEMVLNAAEGLDIDIDEDACLSLGRRARGTARVAINLLRKTRSFADAMGVTQVTEQVVADAMTLEGIDSLGLTVTDQKVLRLLCEQYGGIPVGLENLAMSVGEDYATVRDMVEPELIRRGLVRRYQRGRVATKAAFEHLGLPPGLGVL
jgi:Holliday junction DNA helicase RuvB